MCDLIRVGYIAGEPTASRVPHLDRIAAHPDIDLTVIYAAQSVQRREWSLELRHRSIMLRGPDLPLTGILHHDYPLTPQIWPILERERFDVLVVGGWSLLATQLAICFARVRKVPYLVISENHLREPRSAGVKWIKARTLRHVIPPADGHLVAGTLARDHALHYGAPASRITVFPNTVDVEGYLQAAARLREHRSEIREELAIPEGSVAVIYVGRLIAQKGVAETVQAVARARELTPRPLHLLLVGNGPLRPTLERRAGELEVDVTFAGFRQGESLLRCFAAADTFVLCSRRETWGIVVNEAAAFGLPLVLSSGVGASADLLRAGENGELVPPDDVEAQARAIAKLTDDELRERYGRRSTELVTPWGYAPSVESFAAAVRSAYETRGESARRRGSRSRASRPQG